MSAVDAHVGRHIFDHVIGPEGLLANKTRIFVTHAVNYLKQVDEIIVLKDGEIAERGTYQELLAQKGPFAEYLIQYLQGSQAEDDNSEIDETIVEDLKKTLQSQESLDKSLSPERRASFVRQRSSKSATVDEPKKDNKKQYETEKMATGKVSWRVYSYYIKNMGLVLFSCCLLFFFGYQVCSTAASVWLSIWSDSVSKNETNVPEETIEEEIETVSIDML